jgi:predicted dienelactone hydrolase
MVALIAACGAKPPNNPSDALAPPSDDARLDAPVTTDPAGDGSFAVTESIVSIPGASAGRTLAATAFVPTTGAGRAVVIVSPGFQMSRTQYASYARHLATWGFVAILTDYADGGFFADHQLLAEDVPAVIDWALAQPYAIDAAKIAVVGHSLGGRISVFAATLDARIRAIVGWDPVDANSPSVVPSRMVGLTAAIAVVGETTNASGGGMPCAPAAENFEQFYAAAPSPALKLTVNGADHMDWVDDPSCGLCGFCRPGSADAALARTVSRRVNVAWLRRHLFADAAMDPWLSAPPELTAGTVAIEQR